MNYEEYWKNGMGLHSSQLKCIEDIVINNNVKTIVEFGSGQSTRFLSDLCYSKGFDYKVYSFDHHPQYCYTGKHDFLKSHLFDIISCDDESFENMFVKNAYSRKGFTNCQDQKDDFRTKNSFYDITEDHLPDNIDLVILDGPNGNGRSISFLHLKHKISKNCVILIDDSDHYDFIERCSQVFDTEILVHVNDPQIHPLFNYAIVKIK